MKLRKNIFNQHSSYTSSQKKEGEITIEDIPRKEKFISKDMGNYVDFKEE